MNVISKYIELIKENIECNNLRVYHFEEKIKCNNKGEYTVNIISCEFSSEKDLGDNWKMIVDNVALYVQSNLEKYIELYNVYVIFFMNNIDEQLVYRIEQNKYSSRKIVIKSDMPENTEEIESIISNRLFYFNIEKADSFFSIADILSKNERKLYECLKNKESIKEEDIDEIVEILNSNETGGELID